MLHSDDEEPPVPSGEDNDILNRAFPAPSASAQPFPAYPTELLGTRCSLNSQCVCVSQYGSDSSLQQCTGPCLVMAWKGIGIPSQMQNFIIALGMLNTMSDQRPDQTAVAAKDVTVFQTLPGASKKPVVTALMRNIWKKDDAALDFDPDLPFQRLSFEGELNKELRERDHNVHVRIPPISLVFGIVPVTYSDMEGEPHSLCVSVLKVFLVAGYDLLTAIQLLKQNAKTDAERKTNMSALKGLRDGFLYEVEQNLSRGLLYNTTTTPDPLDVFGCGLNSIFNIGNPFKLVGKILKIMRSSGCILKPDAQATGDCHVLNISTLTIDGFPRVNSVDLLRRVMGDMDDRASAYLNLVRKSHETFKVGKLNKDPLEPVPFPNILFNPETEATLDGIPLQAIVTIDIHGFVSPDATLESASSIALPPLCVALVTAFETKGCVDYAHFVKMFVGSQTGKITIADLQTKKLDSIMSSMPHAGMRKDVRLGFIEGMRSMGDIEDRVKAYINTIRSMLIILDSGIKGNMFMSARIVTQSLLLGMIDDVNFPPLVFNIFNDAREHLDVKASVLYQTIAHDPLMAIEFLYSYLFLDFNSSDMKMNSVNATVAIAIHKNLVTCDFGPHAANWTWLGYTVMVVPGFGQLRVDSDDHGVKRALELTAKPNTTGFSDVVMKFVLACVRAIQYILRNITVDQLNAISIRRIDRATAPSLFVLNAVQTCEGKVCCAPAYDTFGGRYFWDEFLRNVDNAALQALVSMIPRDNTVGSGVIKKQAPPSSSTGGPHKTVDVLLLPGMPLNLLAAATNQNPGILNEPTESISKVTNSMPPGAGPSIGFEEIDNARKRKINEATSMGANCPSSLPTDNDRQEIFGILFAAVPFMCSQIALGHKTGQLEFNIGRISMFLVEWYQSFIQQNLSGLLGKIMGGSVPRTVQTKISIAISRQIQTTQFSNLFLSSQLHPDGIGSVKEASFRTTLDTELCALNLHSCAKAIVDVYAQTLDTNLIYGSSLISNYLETPVLNVQFLVDLLSGRVLNHGCESYIALREWLQKLIDIRTNPNASPPSQRFLISGNYVCLPKLASMYSNLATYLEKFCAIKIGMSSAYDHIWKQCMAGHVSFDWLGVTGKVSTVRELIVAMGLPYDSSWSASPEGAESSLSSFVYLQVEQLRKDPGVIWVNVLQHLVFTALMADRGAKTALHSSNVYDISVNMFREMVTRYVPRQFVPWPVVLTNMFTSSDGDVEVKCVSLPFEVQHPDYILRSKV